VIAKKNGEYERVPTGAVVDRFTRGGISGVSAILLVIV